MHRVGVTALALAALAAGAPITEPTKTVENRDLIFPDPSTGFPGGSIPPPSFTLLPPITGGLEPSDKKRQDTVIVLPPITGGLDPSDKAKRQDTIGIGDGTTDPVKAHIKALELEYETLLHSFGAHPPKPIAKRLASIKDELLTKYGITIVQSPDGTTTTFVPGKRSIVEDDGYVPGGPLFPMPTFPGGGVNPDPEVPGGPIEVSD